MITDSVVEVEIEVDFSVVLGGTTMPASVVDVVTVSAVVGAGAGGAGVAAGEVGAAAAGDEACAVTSGGWDGDEVDVTGAWAAAVLASGVDGLIDDITFITVGWVTSAVLKSS